MQKARYKNRHLSIGILTFLFLGSLSYAVYKTYGPFKMPKNVAEAKQNTPTYFDYGTISDTVYCNDFFRFRIPVPKGHQANYKTYDYTQKSFYERDSVLAKPKIAANITDHDLLIIEPGFVKIDWHEKFMETKSLDGFQDYLSEKTKRERFGADYQLIIRAHNLSGTSLNAYINRFRNLHNPDYGNPKSKSISGLSFRAYEGLESHGGAMQEAMFGSMGGKNKNIISYNSQIHGFALSIELFYQTDEQKCILLDMVDTVRFH